MAFYHHSLYFQLEQSSQAFKDSPPGTIDVSRLVQGKSNYWVDPNSELAQHKKTLVFADFLAFASKDLNQIKKQLNQLLLDGFSLYIWHENQLKLLNSSIIDDMDEHFLSQIQAASDETIAHTAFKDKKIPKDQLHILSPIEFQKLLNKDYQLTEYPLYASTIDQITENKDLKGILSNNISKSKISIKVIDDVILYDYSDKRSFGISHISTIEDSSKKSIIKASKDFDIEELLKYDLSNVTTLDLRECANLTNDDLERILEKVTNIERLTIHDCKSLSLNLKNINKLRHLKHLDLSHIKINQDELDNILKITADLESLELKHCNDNDLTISEDIDLKKLKNLIIYASEFNDVALNHLLSASCNLEKITLLPQNPLTNKFVKPINLPLLREIIVEKPLSQENFEAIIKNSAMINEISFFNFDGFSDKFISSANFNHLKNVRFQNGLFDSDQLETFLLKAPNIEMLDIKHSQNLTENISQDIPLTRLKAFDISYTDLTVNSLAHLLSNAHNLRELVGQMMPSLSGQLTKPLNLPNLHILRLQPENDFQAINLQYLLKNTANLVNLQILNITSNPDQPINDDLDLSNLESIDFNNCQISDADLHTLLSKAPKLKTLDISGCTKLTGSFTDKLNLNNLTRLIVKTSTINSESLLQLLSQTPKLEHLNISSIKIEHIPLDIQLNLPFLQRLIVSKTKLNDQSLNTLLKSTKKLESLYIEECPNITGNFFDGVDLSHLATLRFDKDTALTEENLLTILDHAPKLNREAVLKEFYDITANRMKEKNAVFKEASADANVTFNKNKKLNATKIFISDHDIPEYRDYRKSVYSQLEISDQPTQAQQAFKLKQTSDLALADVNLTAHESEALFLEKYILVSKGKDGKSFYFGKQNFDLTDEFMPIASLSFNEEITDIFIANKKYDGIEIKYSNADNLYYIRSTDHPKSIQLDFVLKANRQPTNINSLPNDVIRYYQFLNSFDSAPEGRLLNMVKEQPGYIFRNLWTYKTQVTQPTGRDYIDLMNAQKLGACRHRAILFKDYMDRKHPEIPVRIVHNDVHAYVEVQHKDQWIHMDLGGYDVTVDADESLFDTLLDRPTKKEVNRPSYPPLTIKAPVIPQRLIPKEKNTSVYKTALDYFNSKSAKEQNIETTRLIQQIISDEKNKTHLIELDQPDELALYQQIYQYANKTSRNVFFVNSPEELALLVPTVKHGKDNTGIVQKAPGGRLFDFLNADHDQDPTIIINYSNFNAAEIVRFNSILDDVRKIDGIEIPQSINIIGIRNQNAQDAYHGSDFLSRFDQRHRLNEVDAIETPVRTLEQQDKAIEGIEIDLFNSQDWKEILFGRWVIDKDQLKYQDGELITQQKALAEYKVLILKNVPQSKDFDAFFTLAKIHGKFSYNGIEIEIPQDFKVINAGKGYDFGSLKDQISKADNQFRLDAITLNPTLFNQFFNQHIIDNHDNTLQTLPGILKAKQGQTIEVNLTRNLTEDQWARLLNSAKDNQVNLIIHTQNNTEFPFDLAIDQTKSATYLFPEVLAVETNDIHYSVEKITATSQFEHASLIHATDLKSADLIKKINGKLDDKTLKFIFSEEEQFLISALKADHDIILYGHFDNELADNLVELIKYFPNYTGHLAFISSNTHALPALEITKMTVSAEDKLQALKDKGYDSANVDLLVDHAQSESFAQLETRASFLKHHGKAINSDLAWHGMDTLSSEIILDQFELTHVAKKAQTFEEQRIQKVTDQLQQSPYVFITGLTGVGKTTTICKHFENNTNYAFYQNQKSIKAWAKDASSKEKILFLDEANLTNTNWSEFEGLFNNPPSIFVDGELIELTSKHKVIFAGNPLSYGDERTLAPLFKNHGSAIEFSPMSLEFIYDRILKPVFKGSDFEGKEKALIEPILSVYQYLCSLSKDEVLISPRELQMMALLTLNAASKDSGNSVKYAQYYSYTLGKNVVPTSKLTEFEIRFKSNRPINLSDSIELERDNSFVITESRLPIKNIINDLLSLRALKQDQQHLSTFSGLGGMILEGEPGIGKSDIVIKTMLENGLKEGKDFYKLPISMPLAEKQALLIKAFNDGAVVMIDEINSAPMLEELLNALLMGKDLQGKRADNPGFMVIGTQNPASLSGRRQASQALERRLIKVDLPPYTKNEMQMILDESGFDQSETIQMVEAYEKAKENNPKLVFRDLMKFAKALAESRDLSDYATTTDKKMKMKEKETDLDKLLGDFVNSGAPAKDLDHHEFDIPKLKHPFTFTHNVSTMQNQTNNIEVEV
ncbi:hypothetical protein L3V83_02210 [Thiotrichales bacterium 19X7-9]|nr:hypothetical protein [Thiotrichales bacterium 19X7-9]